MQIHFSDTTGSGDASGSQHQLGRYEILEPIGAGGRGEAYKALDPHLHRSVTGRQALRRSSIAGWDKAPTHDPLTFLLNFFDPLQRRVLVGGK